MKFKSKPLLYHGLATLLKKMLLVLSFPLLNAPLHLAAQTGSDSLKCSKPDSIVSGAAADSIRALPDYTEPVTVTPCYGVVVPVLPQTLFILPQNEEMLEVEFIGEGQE